MGLPLQFVLLGKGDSYYQKIFEQISKRFPQKVGIHINFDPFLAKRIYAGADIFLMPSRYEPCGLGQMISLHYGTIPVVRKTGGLADTVKEFDPFTEEGDGFLFEKYSSSEMMDALKKAISVYQNKGIWKKLIKNAMEKDFSWDRLASKYSEIYEAILTKLGN